jgi:hypothetical protein
LQLNPGNFVLKRQQGLALYRSKASNGAHCVHVFDEKLYQAQRSTGDVNGVDPQIPHGKPKDLMISMILF